MSTPTHRRLLAASAAVVMTMTSAVIVAPAFAQQPAPAATTPSATTENSKPNILVIFGDDVGQTNISAYSFGVVGYKTPNIDSIAKAGIMFTDYYAENSCTAGRSTFITGQTCLRTGLCKVGAPGAPVACRPATSRSPRR